MNYREYSIAEIATLKYGKMLSKSKMVPNGYPVFSGYRVTGYSPSFMYKDPMLVVVARGVGGTGDVKISPPNSWITNLSIVLDVDERRVDKYFLCMLLGMERLKEKLDTGAAQSQITISSLEPYKIRLPELQLQQTVSGVVRTYDSLIENNLRRIKILEEMAQNLYREWFVKFRFPGHEQVRMVDSPLGKIPEGWEATTVGAVTSYINRGVAPKYDDSSINLVINQKCIRDHKLNLALARRHKSRVIEDKFVQFGDVLINSTGVGILGRVTQVYEKLDDVTVDTHVSIARPSNASDIDFLGLALIELESYFESLGAGATGQTELRRDRIGETGLVFPPNTLRSLFSEQVSLSRKLALNLAARNEVLRQTRDHLLPKLVSGELDVSELDIDIGEAA